MSNKRVRSQVYEHVHVQCITAEVPVVKGGGGIGRGWNLGVKLS